MNQLERWKNEIDNTENMSRAIQECQNNQIRAAEWNHVGNRLPNKEECNRFDVNKNPKFYRMFNCLVKEPGFKKQTKRLYFSEDGHWYDGWRFYDQYVIKWRSLPPHMEI